jgi:hypothetical protein
MSATVADLYREIDQCKAYAKIRDHEAATGCEQIAHSIFVDLVIQDCCSHRDYILFAKKLKELEDLDFYRG